MNRQINLMFEDSIPNVSHQQKMVAQYMLKNFQRGINKNARTIGNEIGVSEATVIRYIKSLGFQTYSEFRDYLIRYEKQMINQKVSISNVDGSENEREVLAKMSTRWKHVMDEVEDKIDVGELMGTVMAIRETKTIYIYSTLFSKHVADDFANIFLLFGKQVQHVTDPHYLKSLILVNEEPKMIIVISKTGEDPKINPVLRLARQMQMPIVAITSNTKSTLGINSDYILKTLNGNPDYPLRDSGTTLLSQMFVVHSIYHLYSLSFFDEGEALWNKVRGSLIDLF
ncbi:MAG: MurR/RpiR family transcriptional regulator [Lactobacillaceae bacterium]|nr:MurR/RpiR family transcriptional regulator [Lactobacillaceae bacterium]